MAIVDVTVYYLEMHGHTTPVMPEPRDGMSVIHARNPTVDYYRFLYNSVGREFDWYSRRIMPDTDLAAILADPRVELQVLHIDGSPAGFVELDRRIDNEIEIVHFGLMGDWIGQGLGKWFLNRTLHLAWSYQPKRVWLHTCTMDHPVALPNYRKAGFVLYKEESIQREVHP